MKINPSTWKIMIIIFLISYVLVSWYFDKKKAKHSFNSLLEAPLNKVSLYKRDSVSGEVKIIGTSLDINFLDGLLACLKSSKVVFSFRDDLIKERYIAKFVNDTSIHEIQILLYENGTSALGGYYKVTDIETGQSENVGNFGRQSNCLMKQMNKI